jgi:hypothetical protein
MKKTIYLMLLAITVFCGSIIAQKPAVVASDKTGWHKIGETTVDFNNDHDEVAVLMADRFSAIKFKVTDAPIDLLDLDVYFEEGDMQNVKVGYAIKTAGESSGAIQLKGGSERNLKKIVFRYKTVANSKDKKAHVEIWGLKTNADKNMKDNNKDMNKK